MKIKPHPLVSAVSMIPDDGRKQHLVPHTVAPLGLDGQPRDGSHRTSA